MHRLLEKLVCDNAIDVISVELFEIEESAMLSTSVLNPENPDADLLLLEMHMPVIRPLVHMVM
jgi:hypothetical protein